MKILIDTNIVLDHLLDRTPFNKAAEWLFTQTELGELETYVGGTTITTIHYLIRKALNLKTANASVEKLLRLFEIAPITRSILATALNSKFTDFEDAVLHEAAIHCGAEAIITRDAKGFRHAKIRTYSPDEFIYSFEPVIAE